MHRLQKFTEIFRKIYISCRECLNQLNQFSDSYCRLEEVNLETEEIIIYCRGTRTIVKSKISDVVMDIAIIQNLTAVQASWLGYYYGSKSHFVNQKRKGLSLNCFKGKYQIISQDRKGEVTYQEINSKKIYKANPIDILSDESLIGDFDPTQACYIGILSGIMRVKSNKKKDIKPRPRLSIVNGGRKTEDGRRRTDR